MKGNLIKRIAAGALALLIVSGGLPLKPVADLLSDTAITASAEETAEKAVIDLYDNYLKYGNTTYNDFTAANFPLYQGKLLGAESSIWVNNNIVANVYVYDVDGKLNYFTYNDSGAHQLDGVYELTSFEYNSSTKNYFIRLTAVPATLTAAPQPNYADGDDFIECSDDTPKPLLTPGTAVNGTVKYYLNTYDPAVVPTEYDYWSDEVPEVTEHGLYKVWYKVEGTDGYFGLEQQCIDVAVHKRYDTITIDPTVPQGAVTVKKSNGADIDTDQFDVWKPVELRSTAKLDITGTEFTDPVELIDAANEEYVYTFSMPDKPLTATHTHSLRLYPGKNGVSDYFGVYCTNEFEPMNELYTITVENQPYNTNAAEAALTVGSNMYADSLAVTNTPEITYYDQNGSALSDAPVDAGTYTAKAVVEYTIGGIAGSRTIEKTFTISKTDIRSDDVSVTITPDSKDYNGSAPSFTASVTINGAEVPAENYEYTVSPSGSAAGDYTVSFTGKNNMKGARSVVFSVNAVNTSDDISVAADNKVYDTLPYSPDDDMVINSANDTAQSFIANSAITYAFAEYDSTKALDAQAYTSEAPVNAGAYAVRVTMALDNYVTVVKYDRFDITPRNISDDLITLEIAEKLYNSDEQTASATLTYCGNELIEDIDFTITSDPQTNANAYYHTAEELAQIPATESDTFTPGAPYTFTVTGQGNYEGSITDNWYIKRRPIDFYGSILNFECAVGETATIQCIVDLDDSKAYFTTDDPDYKNDFAVFINGTEQDLITYIFDTYTNYTITFCGIGNYEGAVTTIRTPAKLSTYGLDFEYIPKEYDGNMLTWADFVKYAPHPTVVSEEEAFFNTCTAENYYGASTFNQNVETEGFNNIQKVSIMDINGTMRDDLFIVLLNSTKSFDYYGLFVIKNNDPSKGIVCDGISAGLNYVAFCSNYTDYEHILFPKVVYISKAKAEHITDVALTAQDKTYDGLPYDRSTITLSSTNAENKVANEVVNNHGAVLYSYAAVPDGYTGELDGLTYTSIPPVNAGHYAVKATTSGDNFEEVSFYDDFTIAKKAVTVTADNQTAVYLQDTLTPTATVDGAVENDLYPENWNALFRYDISGNEKSILDANTPVGTYDIIADETMMSRTRYANYEITAVPATATVNQYDLSQSGAKAATKAVLSQNVLLLSAATQSITENGNLTVTANNRTLTEGTDFILGGDTTGTDVGSYTLTLSGTGNFTGEITLPWRVVSQKVFTGRAASLGEKIELRFFVDNNAAILSEEGTYIEFTSNGETTKTDLTAYNTQDGKRFYGFEAGPSHMTDEITAKICSADGTAVDIMTTTIASYAYDVKKAYPNNEKLIALVDNMLRYGAAAQFYKSYNTNDLPINDLDVAFTDDDIVAAGIESSHRGDPVGTPDGVTFLGLTGSLDSDATMRLVFEVAGSADDYTFTVKDTETNVTKEITPSEYRGRLSVDITGMIPGDYDTKYEVSVTDSNNETMTVTRSFYGYIKSVLEGSYEDRVKLLVKAMYYYNESADSYNA